MRRYKITIDRRLNPQSVGTIKAERKDAALTKLSLRMIDEDVERITIKEIGEFECAPHKNWID